MRLRNFSQKTYKIRIQKLCCEITQYKEIFSQPLHDMTFWKILQLQKTSQNMNRNIVVKRFRKKEYDFIIKLFRVRDRETKTFVVKPLK